MTAMQRVAVLAVAALAGGCGAGGLAIANGTALGVSSAALACDWQQTRRFAEVDWRQPVPGARPEANAFYRWSESNPMLGPHPSTTTVDLYFAAALAVTAVAWKLMPSRYRWIVPVAVTAIQIKAINETVGTDFRPGLCGTDVMR